ncbi:hypothetical protein EV686_1144 [Paracandidimonas soli]|uniref:Uncharacterized protein n=1 Tax=Paracandidimonas soli TaxID=1917182 RepID=A0A4R3UPD6_9BURK|nr:hypothetical protein EV686_1144 [Paracandidimonas soli]
MRGALDAGDNVNPLDRPTDPGLSAMRPVLATGFDWCRLPSSGAASAPRWAMCAAGAVMRMTGQTSTGGSMLIVLWRAYVLQISARPAFGLPRCSVARPSRGAFVAAYGRPVGVEFPALERIPRPQYLSGFGPAVPTLGWHLAPGTNRSVRWPVVDILEFGGAVSWTPYAKLHSCAGVVPPA